jgi:hypothetical protein
MLAPLRDYLLQRTQGRPRSSVQSRSVTLPGCQSISTRTTLGLETQWITSEDVNVEHLLDVFTTVDASSDDVWEACAKFMEHLYWHKKRLTILGPKIEGLPDDHISKPRCLFELARLFAFVGNLAECKRLLAHALGLWRERGSDPMVAQALKVVPM